MLLPGLPFGIEGPCDGFKAELAALSGYPTLFDAGNRRFRLLAERSGFAVCCRYASAVSFDNDVHLFGDFDVKGRDRTLEVEWQSTSRSRLFLRRQSVRLKRHARWFLG